MLLGEQPQALKVAEVARRLQVDPRTVYGMIRRGELRGVKAGRVWRVPVESLTAFLQAAGRADLVETIAQPTPPDDRVARIKALRGKYRNVLSTVDELIARKQEEIALENRRWPRDDR
jgi:excisionase family DNA binding protein